MSYTLSSIKQIRFPVYSGAFGAFEIVINRPGYPDLAQAATDILKLSRVTDKASGDFSPYLEGDVQLSSKFTTTKGRRALDDMSLAVRDSYGYTGTVNGVATAEYFLPDFLTFFDVWFDETEPYKAFIAWKDALTGATTFAHEGWIDPLYKPSTDPEVTGIGTAEQVWRGTRTIKITEFAQITKTWNDVLALIGEGDTLPGVPYLGFMTAPPGCAGKNQSYENPFSSNHGNLFLAVPHYHLNSPDADPILIAPSLSVHWPDIPWSSSSSAAQIAAYDMTTGGISYGTGYNVGDTGTLSGGTTLATYEVLEVSVIHEATLIRITNGGAGYVVGLSTATSTSGGGSGLIIHVNRVGSGQLWGPNGTVMITVGTVLQKCAQVLGLNAFNPATDLVSALDFFAQKADNAAKNFPVDPTPIPLDELYISLNVFAKSHPADGSFWDNPVGFSPDVSVTDAITGLCNFLLSDYNAAYDDTDGSATLALSKFGASGVDISDTQLVPIGVPSQEEPASSPRSVVARNKGDKLETQCPVGTIGDQMQVEVPVRLHRIGNTSGDNSSIDRECIEFDADKKLDEQADECFKIAWIDNSGQKQLNSECWKSLCYVFWFHLTNVNVVYPSNVDPFPTENGAGGWANSFYVVNACYKSGDVPPPDLCAEVRGNEYFNTRAYHSVGFAALNLPLDSVQKISYAGSSDNTGSVRNIGKGIVGTWRYGPNAAQDWRGSEVTQLLIAGTTDITWQAQPSAAFFPSLTEPGFAFGPVGSGGSTGTSSGTTGTTSNGGATSSGSGNIVERPISTAQNTITIPSDGIVFLSFQGITGQSSHFIDVRDHSGTIIFKVDAAGFLTATGARFTQNVDMSSAAIENLAIPTNDFDAANKVYVDGIVETVGAFSANQNDLVLGAGKNVFRISATGAVNLTGIVPAGHAGKITLINVAANVISLLNSNAGSTAANRFLFSGNKVLALNGVITLWYDVISSRWRDFSIGG